MEMIINSGKAVTGVISIGFSYLFGGWSALLVTLIAFVAFDYITGLIAAGYKGELNSRVGLYGIARKVLIFCLVAIAGLVDHVIAEQLGNAFAIGEFNLSVATATILFYLVNEFISISENLGKLDVYVPPALKKAIALFDDSFNKGDE
jgi:toxin secretion/phage lysis holin